MLYVCIIIINNYIKCPFHKEVYISETCLIYHGSEKNIFLNVWIFRNQQLKILNGGGYQWNCNVTTLYPSNVYVVW